MSMGGGRRRTIEPRFIFAALATLVLVPFVIADLTGGDSGDAEVATEANGDEPVVDEGDDAAADDSADVDEGAVTFELDPEWLGRGMSRYGESDDATTARIERWRKLSAGESVEDLPAIDEVTPPPAKDSSDEEEESTSDTSGQDLPATTSAPATSPPATAAPSTAPPSTAPPTTAAPTTTVAPVTTTTRVATTTTLPPAGDG